MKKIANEMAEGKLGRPVPDDARKLVGDLVVACEKVLDGWATASPRRIVPRHGRFGEAAHEHLGEFLTR